MNITANNKKRTVSSAPLNACMSGALEINLKAIQENYRLCDSKTEDTCQTAAVVKADGYGLGIDAVAPALWDAGARIYYVATVEEGMELRSILPEAQIKILNGVLPGLESAIREFNLEPVLNNHAQAKLLNTFAQETAQLFKASLHVDTGMNRLGFRREGLQSFLSDQTNFDGLNIEMVMSHFVMAEDQNSDKTDAQYSAFQALYETYKDRYKFSLSNSYGLFRNKKYQYQESRAGMALYGLNSDPENENPMRAVVNLSVPVLQVHHAKSGETAGYSATYVFPKDTKLATVSLGYADGFLRSLSNAGRLFFKGHACPVVGRVSMDLVILDISHLPERDNPCVGDMMEILGPNQSADTLAEQAGTIGYEILTSLGKRYKRIYKND